MHDVHRPCIDVALVAVAHFVGVTHAAIDGLGKAGVDLGRSDDEPWIDRTEEYARWRHRDGAVHLVEHAVAEDAVMIEVVGNGQIKRLIEVAEPFCRPAQNRRGQNRENKQTENRS